MATFNNPHEEFDVTSFTHPFVPGQQVRTFRIILARRPLFFSATILRPVVGIADFYEGCVPGLPGEVRFFVHPLPVFQTESALLQHWRASLSPETFGPGLDVFERTTALRNGRGQ